MTKPPEIFLSMLSRELKGDFAPEAYEFLLESLEYTLAKLHKRRHVSGKELSRGILEHAKKEFGPMALTVLNQWGLYRTADFGEIVFRLIRLGLMTKSESDKKSDFSDVYRFEEVFSNANV